MTTRPGETTSRAGGVVIGVRSHILVRGIRAGCEEVIVGRVMSVTFWHNARVIAHIVGIHIDLALSGGQQLSVFRHLAAAGGRHPEAVSVVGGDWNFMQRDEERLRMDGSELRDAYMEADRFESVMQRFAEVSQPHYTFRRRGLVAGDAFSRIDRWNTMVDEVCFRRLLFLAGVVGAFAAAHAASDNLPITLTISAREACGCRRRRLHTDVVKSEVYQAILCHKLDLLDITGSPARRLDALVAAAHSATKVAERALLRLTVEAALRYLALARA